MKNDGDISPGELKVFYEAVRKFYTIATICKYVLAKVSLKDEVLQSASFKIGRRLSFHKLNILLQDIA